MRLKYDIKLMGYRTIFENTTRASVKDCFLRDNLLLIIVNENNIGRAIGKNGVNIKRLEMKFNKRIKIVEFSNDLLRFAQNLISPIKAKDISIDNGTIKITLQGIKEKGQVIGRDSKNLQELKNIISLYFDIKEIRIQ